jgi:hypothetical protein
MRASAVDFMAKKAAENFKLNEVSFVGFEKVDIDEQNSVENNDEDFSADIEVWANLSIEYAGNPPDSYRVLNRMLQDWVDDHDGDIKKLVNPKLIDFLKENYENLDVSDLNQDFDDYIWEDQVDYMPDIDEDKKKIQFTVELVLEIEEQEDDED